MKRDSFTPNEFRIEGNIVWIKLTQGQETCVDLGDWERVRRHRWYAQRGRKTYYGATMLTTNGKRAQVYLHKFLLQAPVVDHKDGDGLLNLRNNLRGASYSQNRHNQKRKRTDCTSRFKGVNFHALAKKWRVEVAGNYVGLFVDETIAAKAYDETAIKYFGEFAALNFPATKSPSKERRLTHGLSAS